MRRNRSTTQTLSEELRQTAAGQAGVVHRDQLLESGVSGDAIRRWAVQGRLDPRYRWTYALPGTGQSLESRAWSAQLSVPGAAATSSQALALMGVISELTGPFETVRSSGQPRPQRGLIMHRTDYLPTDDLTKTNGIRHAAFPRAVLDLAARANDNLVARAVDRSVRLRLYDQRAFDRLLSEFPHAPGWPCLGPVLHRLDETAGLKRSELERRLIELIVESGMPTPLVNSMVGSDEVDARWHGTRAIVEADGREFHTSPEDVAADIAKRERLEALGFVLKYVDWDAVKYEPERTIARIEAFRLANLAPPVPRIILPASVR